MSNRRVIFSNKAIAFSPIGSTSYTPVHGAQAAGITTNFNLEQVFELSNQSIYENIEGSPDIQVTLSKVLDGYCPIYLLATRGATYTSLVSRAAQDSIFALAIHDDTVTAATGIPIKECHMSGMVVGSVSYNFAVDGSFTEDVTLQGREKVWRSSNFLLTNFTEFENDEPLSINGSGGVQRREDIIYSSTALTGVDVGFDVNGQVDSMDVTILPPDIDGVGSSGLVTRQSDGSWSAHVQNIGVSFDFGREEVFELGNRAYYARFANPLTEVSTSISTYCINGDNISATNAGILGNGNNLSNRTIKIRTREGLHVNLGYKNKLASVEEGGGDAGGGNETITYNYTNFNDCSVAHPMDVTTALRIAGPQGTLNA